MSSSTRTPKVVAPPTMDVTILQRVASEGYGEGAWHGPDLKAALTDVTKELAFWRPGRDRHNIAEIAVHHAFTLRSVRARLAGPDGKVEPFVLEGEDWFTLGSEKDLAWKKVLDVVASQQERLLDAVGSLASGRVRLAEDVKPFDLVLGATCHAVYHAGQIQLIKVLASASS